LLDLLIDLLGRSAVEWRQQRQTDLASDGQERMILQHFDRGQHRGCRNLACGDVGCDRGLGLFRVLANDGRCVVAAEGPAAFPRLAAGTRRDMSFAPADTAVTVAHLDDDRLELGEGAVGRISGRRMVRSLTSCNFIVSDSSAIQPLR
jgi:hypothetical protein